MTSLLIQSDMVDTGLMAFPGGTGGGAMVGALDTGAPETEDEGRVIARAKRSTERPSKRLRRELGSVYRSSTRLTKSDTIEWTKD